MIDAIDIGLGEGWVQFYRPGQLSGVVHAWPYLLAASVPRQSVYMGDGSFGDGEATALKLTLDPRAAFFLFGPLRIPVRAWSGGQLVFSGHVSRLVLDNAIQMEAQT